MTFRDKTLTAWSNLGRRKVRTALTSIGVVVGIMTLVTLVSLATGVRLQVLREFEKIGLDRVVVRPSSEGGGGGFGLFDFGERTRLITPADIARWKEWPQVREVVPEIDMPAGVQARLIWNGTSTPVRISGENPMRRGPFSDPPAALAGSLEVLQAPGKMVVNRYIVNQLKVTKTNRKSLIGQPVTLEIKAPRGETQKYDFAIMGISDGGSRNVQIATADRIAIKNWWYNEKDSLQKDGYDSVTLRAADVNGAKLLVVKLRKEKWRVESIDRILDVANRIFAVITLMLSLVGGIALLVASIGIVNTMIMSIYERTREIGTLKAMGASRADIRWMFMIEAGLIGMLGGVTGLALSWVLSRILNRGALWYAEQHKLPLPETLFVITPLLALQAIGFATLIGVVAGLYPANRAASLDPLAALRHE
jgi:putative ABC transport system permease protein